MFGLWWLYKFMRIGKDENKDKLTEPEHRRDHNVLWRSLKAEHFELARELGTIRSG